jgi:glycosyltransferase involved in cell wall biosynthesis
MRELITIVTIVFNAEDILSDTINSVISQTYDNIEYIIIDGKSTDQTISIIKKFESHIDHWISESDYGVYDAMNKSLPLINGKWVNFMNAGDVFNDKDTVAKISTILNKTDADVVYGDVEIDYGNYSLLKKANSTDYLYKGMPFCHQSSFIRSKIMKRRKFDLRYDICADFNLFYTMYKMQYKFLQVDFVISHYLSGGISDLQNIKSIVEKWNIVGYKALSINSYYLLIFIRVVFINAIKKIIGRDLVSSIKKKLK